MILSTRTKEAIKTGLAIVIAFAIAMALGWGIAQKDGSTGFDLLPKISPTFEWIRLAQRVPVRIHLEKVPDGVELRFEAKIIDQMILPDLVDLGESNFKRYQLSIFGGRTKADR